MNKIYYEGNPEVQARAIVIQFTENFLGNAIWELSEMKEIKNMLKNSRQGLKIQNARQKEIVDLMHKMIDQSGAEEIISLLTILNIISEDRSTKLLSGKTFSDISTHSRLGRINAVFAFIFENFSDNITLEEAAEVANMSPTAFIRSRL